MGIFRNIKFIKTTRRIKRRYRPGGRKKVNMYYKTDAGEEVEYYLQTDPPEAMYWSTYRLKLTHVKLKNKYDKEVSRTLKKEIFDSIKNDSN